MPWGDGAGGSVLPLGPTPTTVIGPGHPGR